MPHSRSHGPRLDLIPLPMPRKTYETAEMRSREELVLQRLAHTWGCEYGRYEKFSPVDALLFYQGNPYALVEVKIRKMTWGRYPDIMLSESKWDSIMEMSAESQIPWVFIVSLQSGGDYYYAHANGDRFHVEYGGRTAQTRDRWDIENVVKIPCDRFKRV